MRALQLDPLSNEAAADLAILETRSGYLRGAAELWQGVFGRAPYSSAVGMDLAIVFCVAGQKEVARQYVQRVLEFNPAAERTFGYRRANVQSVSFRREQA